MVTIAGFLIDATISIARERSSEVTDNPVEDGSAFADNIRPLPLMLTLDCVVSDTPIGQAAVARAGATTLPSSDARALLTRIHTARQPITIQTDTDTFESMAVQSITDTEDAGTGEALRFRAVFKQVSVVRNSRSVTRTAVPNAQKKRRRGPKTTKKFDTPAFTDALNEAGGIKAERNRSMLSRIF